MGTQFLITTIGNLDIDLTAVAITGLVLSFSWAVLSQFQGKG